MACESIVEVGTANQALKRTWRWQTVGAHRVVQQTHSNTSLDDPHCIRMTPMLVEYPIKVSSWMQIIHTLSNILFVVLDLHTWHPAFCSPAATLSNLRHGLNCARRVKQSQLTRRFKQCLGLMHSAENDSRRRSGIDALMSSAYFWIQYAHGALLPFILFSEFQCLKQIKQVYRADKNSSVKCLKRIPLSLYHPCTLGTPSNRPLQL
jgi:hypothetical protein